MSALVTIVLIILSIGAIRRRAAIHRLTSEVETLRLRIETLEGRDPDTVTEPEPEPDFEPGFEAEPEHELVPRAERGPRVRPDWERWIGTHLLALGGAGFLLLGTSFFVALAISNGWLTPTRQVVLAVVAGTAIAALALRLRDAEDRARDLLAQSLAGAGAGAVVLGLVAGARVYDTAVVPTWLALVGSGLAGGYLVFCGWRWRAQAAAALGITTMLVAPPLVGAHASLASATFIAIALVVAGIVTVHRAWPWLAHAGLWLTAPQLYAWLDQHRAAFVHGTATASLALGMIAVVAGWWALTAVPAIVTERAGGWRVAPASVIVGATSVATAIGFHTLGFAFHPSGWPVRLLAVTLIALHAAGAIALWRTARPVALLLTALGGAIAAIAATAVVGAAGQGLFWSIEAIALVIVARRERDLQSAIAGAAAFALALLAVLKTAPVTSLAYGTTAPAGAALAGGALVIALAMGAAFGERATRRRAWLVAAGCALAWTIQAVVVSLVAAAPGSTSVSQTAQLAATVALSGLAILVIVAASIAAPRAPRHAIAVVLATLLAVKATALDLALGAGTVHAAIGIPVIVVLLVTLALASGRGETRLDLERVPTAAPAIAVAVLGLLGNLQLDAWAIGSTHLRSSLALWAALAVALLALATHPGNGRRVAVLHLAAWRGGDSAIAAWLLWTSTIALAAAAATTFLTSHAGAAPVDRTAQEVVTALLVAWWVASASLASRQIAPAVFARAPGVLGVLVAAKVLLVDVHSLQHHPGGLVIDALVMTLAAAWPLRTLQRTVPVSGPAGLPAIATLALGAVALAGIEAVASGTSDARRSVVGLALAAILALATALRHEAPERWRHGLVIGAVIAGVWAESIALVTTVTPTLGTVDRGAQLGLSIGWAATAIGLIAVGLVRRGSIAAVARRSGIPLLGIAIAKVLAYDTAQVSIAQRAGLFLAIGTLLLVGAYLYTRLVGRGLAPSDG